MLESTKDLQGPGEVVGSLSAIERMVEIFDFGEGSLGRLQGDGGSTDWIPILVSTQIKGSPLSHVDMSCQEPLSEGDSAPRK